MKQIKKTRNKLPYGIYPLGFQKKWFKQAILHKTLKGKFRYFGLIKQLAWNQRSKRKLTASILTFVLILKTIIGVFAPINISVTPPYVKLQETQAAGEGWYDANWTKRKAITVTENSGSTLTNYQVKITVAYDSDMRADFDDIRFTDSDGSTLIDHWLESKTDSTTADFWVEIPTVTASLSKTIYLYYGNPSAASASNYFSTFDVLGDGSSGALTVSDANTIVNTYAYFTGNEPAGDSTIAINNGTGFSNGDEILIIQMQNYSGGTAGTYEFRKINSGGGTASLTLNAPLKNSYTSGTFNSTAATVTQVVRVPQYTNVTINSGASITPSAWNGYSGGVVAFKASGTVTVASGGSIAVVVALGVYLVGGLITAALIAIPAASAKNISKDLRSYKIWAVAFGVISAIAGILIAQFAQLPAGPMVVVSGVAVFLISVIFRKRLL